MYRGEGDESELASLSALLVMSPSKTSLIFNGVRLRRRRERERKKERERKGGTQTSCLSAHTLTERVTCTLALRLTQGSPRLNGVEKQRGLETGGMRSAPRRRRRAREGGGEESNSAHVTSPATINHPLVILISPGHVMRPPIPPPLRRPLVTSLTLT